jgi:hypothetical protein
MGTHTAIADAGESLVTLLRDRLTSPSYAGDPDPVVSEPEEIELGSPKRLENGVRLSVYLYRIAENGDLKNADPREPRPGPEPPRPLELDLYYLITAYPGTGGTDETANTLQQHVVLGRVMQVLQEVPILRGPDLQGSLAGGDAIPLSIVPEGMETVTSLWGTFSDTPFEPSVAYLVGPVPIEPTVEATTGRVTGLRLETSLDTGVAVDA